MYFENRSIFDKNQITCQLTTVNRNNQTKCAVMFYIDLISFLLEDN